MLKTTTTLSKAELYNSLEAPLLDETETEECDDDDLYVETSKTTTNNDTSAPRLIETVVWWIILPFTLYTTLPQVGGLFLLSLVLWTVTANLYRSSLQDPLVPVLCLDALLVTRWYEGPTEAVLLGSMGLLAFVVAIQQVGVLLGWSREREAAE